MKKSFPLLSYLGEISQTKQYFKRKQINYIEMKMVGFFRKLKSIWWFSPWNSLASFLEFVKSVKTWIRIRFIWLKVYFYIRFPCDIANGFCVDKLEIIPSMWTLFKNVAPLFLAKASPVLNKLNENDTLVKRKAVKRAKSVYDKLSAGC